MQCGGDDVFHASRIRGVATCSCPTSLVVVEVTGNITFMDRLERLAFNALPAGVPALQPLELTRLPVSSVARCDSQRLPSLLESA